MTCLKGPVRSVMVRLVFAVCVAFSLLSVPHNVASQSGPGPDEPFPGYTEECGYPIIFTPVPTVAQAAVTPEQTLVILLDPSLRAREERPRMIFLIAHECAHHRLKHSEPKARRRRARFTEVVRDQEMSADCWAAETLARRGLEHPLFIMVQRFYRGGLYSPGGGYPSGIQRSAIINQCADQGRQRRSASQDTAP